MRRIAPLFLIAVLASPAAAKPSAAREPVVVELFTSQGCSGCPQANEVLMELADKPGVIALTFAVDYWDYLGWRDTFAKPEFTERQRAYQTAMSLRDVYTPQFVIDGKRQLSGGKPDDVAAAVHEEAVHRAYPPDMAFPSADRVAVGSGKSPRGGAQVWLVRYEDADQEVAVKRGENKGQTVRHGNVVRELVKLGSWKGRPAVFRLPKAEEPGLKTVVLVQARDGRILAAKQR
ncbi:DUF1223 domain-containing protein [Caulobacter sp. 17J65-9]|uniref:DUF1223 domain-containing protein n=1 Tax=Caulobacter sp. 17J65-9 TaxID=2709382 RepID=UPI0013CBB67C|nr:DUF1223 domain-containing protein [Caulobacter sp. 17J65-9]NEX92401.1 DUF1223 domain-containing protein [Caulobacter sp. 17J65-9]